MQNYLRAAFLKKLLTVANFEANRARVRIGWENFKDLSGELCGRKWSIKLMRRQKNMLQCAKREGNGAYDERCEVRKYIKSSIELRSMARLREDIATEVRISRLK